jgi:hypothetical protein
MARQYLIAAGTALIVYALGSLINPTVGLIWAGLILVGLGSLL